MNEYEKRPESRTKNAIKNTYYSLVFQVVNIFVKFVMRTIFTICLGKQYLGINGVFSNILTILSLSELGVGGAIVYSMYKPIAENHSEKIAQYVNYYKKIYLIIGGIIIAIGLLILPFLDYIITDISDIPNLNLIYVLYLVQTVSSYFFAQYTSLIMANQLTYETKKIQMVVSLVKAISQSIFLLITRNFIIYQLLDILFTITTGYLIYCLAIRLFPFIKGEAGKLEKSETTFIWNNALSSFSIKVGITVINSTDNLVISMLISTIMVGMYSNYAMIVQIILTSTVLVQQSVMAGIGNICVSGNDVNKKRVFDRLFFLYGFIYMIVASCLLNLFQPFLLIWLGDGYMLEYSAIVIIVLNCYLSGMHQVNEAFIFSDGLYRFFRLKPWIEAFLNLIISVMLAKKIGFIGVLIGTTISHFVLTFWYDALVVYRYSFHKNIYDYFMRYGLYAVITVIAIIVEKAIDMVSGVVFSMVWSEFIIKLVISVIMPALTWCLFLRKTDEYHYYKELIKKIIMKDAG